MCADGDNCIRATQGHSSSTDMGSICPLSDHLLLCTKWYAYPVDELMLLTLHSCLVASIVTMGHRDLILELCQRRAPGLTEEANSYLSSLQTVLEV